jgi:hypothetical protein
MTNMKNLAFIILLIKALPDISFLKQKSETEVQ